MLTSGGGRWVAGKGPGEPSHVLEMVFILTQVVVSQIY